MTIQELFDKLITAINNTKFPQDSEGDMYPSSHKQMLLGHAEYLRKVCGANPTAIIRTSSAPMASWMYIVENGKSKKHGYNVFKEFEGNDEARRLIKEFLDPSRENYNELCERLSRK